MAAERLTDDILVEILSRVPAKSLCRFKCVSKHWLGLTNDCNYRKKLPQTLAGFFHSSTTEGRFLESPVGFTSLSGSSGCPPIDTSFDFLPSHRRLDLLDCCNGLLLFRWYDIAAQDDEFRYVVCNPATEKWTVLPDSGQAHKMNNARLGFDPAMSPHFHVFELEEGEVEPDHWGTFFAVLTVYYFESGVSVYSSETGGWVHKEKRPNQHVKIDRIRSATVFLNGSLHFHAFEPELSGCLAAVDTEAETWTNFRVPGGLADGFIQWSQGRLHYVNFQEDKHAGACRRLVVYVLENYNNKKWILKHSVEQSYIFKGMSFCYDALGWIAIHPEHNLIFFTVECSQRNFTFMSYNMDRRQVKVICNLEDGQAPYLPYVPLYAELPTLHT